MRKKVVLAYSGGLDTACILKVLQERDCEIIAFVADVGQQEDFEAVAERARANGAAKGVPFREAYRSTEVPAKDVSELWRTRIHLGAPGDSNLDFQHALVAESRTWLDSHRPTIDPRLAIVRPARLK